VGYAQLEAAICEASPLHVIAIVAGCIWHICSLGFEKCFFEQDLRRRRYLCEGFLVAVQRRCRRGLPKQTVKVKTAVSTHRMSLKKAFEGTELG